jgi:hypothetical protein
MKHLSPEQLVDVAEGRGEPSMNAHAASCDDCRASVDELRDVLALVRTDGVPEPSPLFWDHMSARVGSAVRSEADSRVRRVSWVWRWGPVSALGAVALVVALVVMPRDAARVGPRASVSTPPAPAADATAIETDAPAPADDAPWMLMRELSQDISADEAGAALPARPGTADTALGHLDEKERAALAEIIREEIARATAHGAAPSDQ